MENGITLEEIQEGKVGNQPDPVSAIVKDCFRVAREYRLSHMLGENSVEQTLINCYDQYNSVVTPQERELMARYNIDLKISMTKNKVDVLDAWVRDLLQQSAESPFVVSSTPIPELSNKDRRAIAVEVYKEFQKGEQPLTYESPIEDIGEHLKIVSEAYKRKQKEAADKKASNMQTKIDDQLADGGFRDQYIAFMRNLIQYPYAVMMGPILERRASLEWDGKKVVDKYTIVPVIRNVSPFDYFWSPDTTLGGTGQFDIIRERVSREYLKECSTLESWITANVNEALSNYENIVTYSYGWPFRLYPIGDDPDPDLKYVTHDSNLSDMVTILRYFGKISGRVLKLYGIEGVEDTEYREVEAIVLGEWTLRLRIREEPVAAGRPVYATSYTKTNDSVAGYGVAQVLRPFERGLMAAIRSTLSNAAYSSLPLGEVDVSRIAEFGMGDIGRSLVPGVFNPVSPSIGRTSEPAYRVYSMSNYTASLWQLALNWQQLADQYVGLPAALSGQPVGTGVNRTFRGIAQLYGNALKGVQSAFTNVDTDVLERVGKNFYINNMIYSDDDSIKGDSKVVSRGMSGLLKNELQKQSYLDLLDALAPLANNVPQGIMGYAIKKAMVALGIPEDVWDDAVMSTNNQQQQQLLMGQSQAPQPQPQPQQQVPMPMPAQQNQQLAE